RKIPHSKSRSRRLPPPSCLRAAPSIALASSHRPAMLPRATQNGALPPTNRYVAQHKMAGPAKATRFGGAS
uniref:Uncharacterized protein n=1 Tax=Triticum urartu TaxID=4572 RepID=A0A8R7P8D1_TRIUA